VREFAAPTIAEFIPEHGERASQVPLRQDTARRSRRWGTTQRGTCGSFSLGLIVPSDLSIPQRQALVRNIVLSRVGGTHSAILA
jgi:hypothetical protein